MMTYRNNGSARALASGLGWFSIGLGLAEITLSKTLAAQLGMQGKEWLLRAYGIREMAAGIGTLASGDPAPWIWGRVAGDIVDLATLAAGLNRDNPCRTNVAIALGAVAGVTALDGLCARAPAGAGMREPPRDYSDRRGMPKPPDQMRGAARDFQIPRDTRTSEALRPFTS